MPAPILDDIKFIDSSLRAFKWTRRRQKAALILANAYTQCQTADAVGVTQRCIAKWLNHPEFTTEVDRLSLMVGIASRAERVRLAMQIARQRVQEDGQLVSDKDLLDWLKFAQSETDGAKLDLAAILAALERDEEISAPKPGDGETETKG